MRLVLSCRRKGVALEDAQLLDAAQNLRRSLQGVERGGIEEGAESLGRLPVGHAAEEAPVVDVLEDQRPTEVRLFPSEERLYRLGERQAFVRRDACDETQGPHGACSEARSVARPECVLANVGCDCGTPYREEDPSSKRRHPITRCTCIRCPPAPIMRETDGCWSLV